MINEISRYTRKSSDIPLPNKKKKKKKKREYGFEETDFIISVCNGKGR